MVFFKLEELNFLATRGVLVLIMILGLKVHGIVRGRECMESFYYNITNMVINRNNNL